MCVCAHVEFAHVPKQRGRYLNHLAGLESNSALERQTDKRADKWTTVIKGNKLWRKEYHAIFTGNYSKPEDGFDQVTPVANNVTERCLTGQHASYGLLRCTVNIESQPSGKCFLEQTCWSLKFRIFFTSQTRSRHVWGHPSRCIPAPMPRRALPSTPLETGWSFT